MKNCIVHVLAIIFYFLIDVSWAKRDLLKFSIVNVFLFLLHFFGNFCYIKIYTVLFKLIILHFVHYKVTFFIGFYKCIFCFNKCILVWSNAKFEGSPFFLMNFLLYISQLLLFNFSVSFVSSTSLVYYMDWFYCNLTEKSLFVIRVISLFILW